MTDETAPSPLERLIEQILDEMRLTSGYTGRDGLSDSTLAALRKVPREAFVPEDERRLAFANHPLPIGHAQTISQPYIVALMTELLELTPESRVLEIGTGSGYQTAMLAELAGEVYSIEVIRELADTARARLEAMGYANVHVRHGDGHAGWPEAAPFDAIIVTAAADEIPPALVEQLVPGGRLVIPVGPPWYTQYLRLLRRTENGDTDDQPVLPVAFVPLVYEKPETGESD
jgi:protein-L-isoaspartate(D-aspartate) O-methyltransferase